MTSDIKSYYKITQLLKQYNFPFLSLIPDNKIPQTVNLIITTNSEKHKILTFISAGVDGFGIR